MGVLVETMRRMLTVSRPKVVFKIDKDGQKLEPVEEVIIDVDDNYTSSVIDSMNKRRAMMIDMSNVSGKTRLIFKCPSRSLIGYHSQFLTETRGTGVINNFLIHMRDIMGMLNLEEMAF